MTEASSSENGKGSPDFIREILPKSLEKDRSTFSGSREAPEAPRELRIRPQLASSPKNADLTKLEVMIAFAAVRASPIVLAPSR